MKTVQPGAVLKEALAFPHDHLLVHARAGHPEGDGERRVLAEVQGAAQVDVRASAVESQGFGEAGGGRRHRNPLPVATAVQGGDLRVGQAAVEDAELVQKALKRVDDAAVFRDPAHDERIGVVSVGNIGRGALAADFRSVHPHRVGVAATSHNDVVPLLELEGAAEARFRGVPAEEPLGIGRAGLKIQLPAIAIDLQADVALLVAIGEAPHEKELKRSGLHGIEPQRDGEIARGEFRGLRQTGIARAVERHGMGMRRRDPQANQLSLRPGHAALERARVPVAGEIGGRRSPAFVEVVTGDQAHGVPAVDIPAGLAVKPGDLLRGDRPLVDQQLADLAAKVVRAVAATADEGLCGRIVPCDRCVYRLALQ